MVLLFTLTCVTGFDLSLLSFSSYRGDNAYRLVRVCRRPVLLGEARHHGEGRPRSALCRHPPAHPRRHGRRHEAAVSPEDRKCNAATGFYLFGNSAQSFAFMCITLLFLLF